MSMRDAAHDPSWPSRVEVYDTTTNQWSTRAPLTHAIGEATCGAIGGAIYLAGGWAIEGFATMARYDPATNAWANKTPMSESTGRTLGTVIDGSLLVLFRERFERYDPTRDH